MDPVHGFDCSYASSLHLYFNALTLEMQEED